MMHDFYGIQFFEWDLTLILLEPKMISLKMPPLKSQASLHIFAVWITFCTVGFPTFNFDIPKNDNGHFQIWKVDYSI